MDRETTDRIGEDINNWKQIVQALWMLNYICVGFKGFFPRLRGTSQSLDDLAQVIPSIRKEATTNVLEGELKKMMSQFVEGIELLNQGQERINALLHQLEAHRMDLKAS